MGRRYSAQHGFSLVEILVVIAIIGVLASVVMPAMDRARERALIAKTVSELDSIKKAMEALYGDTRRYPNGTDGVCRGTLPSNNEIDLSVAAGNLVANGGSYSGWNGPYLSSAVDAWGTPYYLDEDYRCMAETEGCRGVADAGNDSSVIVSCGPNAAVVDGSCAYDADNIVYRLCD